MKICFTRLNQIILLMVFSLSGFSQITPKDSTSFESTFSMFRDPSYISAFGGIGNIEPLVFEADIVPYFMVSLNRNSRWGVELSPRFILRMFNEKSLPVRTPSFIPRATFFYRISPSNIVRQDIFTYFSWCHHSNGQDGNFFNSDSTAINTSSGNFSTNLIEGGLFLSHPDRRLPKAALNYIKFSMIYHYFQSPELRNIYGRLRFNTDFQSSVNISKVLETFGHQINSSSRRNAFLSQSIRIGWIAGSLNNAQAIDTKRIIFRYTISFKPSFFNDVTIFAQYYYGQDYYNIYFSRTLKVLRFGLAAKTSIFN